MNQRQMQKMLAEAQKAQTNMQKEQSKIEKKEFEYTVAGGGITFKVLGSKEIVSIEINEELLDPEEKDVIEDLMKTGLNTIFSQIDKEFESVMGQLTAGLPF